MPLALGKPAQLPHEVYAGHATGKVNAQFLGRHDHGGAVRVHDLAATNACVHLGVVAHLQQLVCVHADQVGETSLLDEGVGRLDRLLHRPRIDGRTEYLDTLWKNSVKTSVPVFILGVFRMRHFR